MEGVGRKRQNTVIGGEGV